MPAPGDGANGGGSFGVTSNANRGSSSSRSSSSGSSGGDDRAKEAAAQRNRTTSENLSSTPTTSDQLTASSSVLDNLSTLTAPAAPETPAETTPDTQQSNLAKEIEDHLARNAAPAPPEITDPCKDMCHPAGPTPEEQAKNQRNMAVADAVVEGVVGSTGIGGAVLGAIDVYNDPSLATIGMAVAGVVPGVRAGKAAVNGVEAVADANKAIDAAKDAQKAVTSRPSWQASEVDVGNKLGPGFTEQKSFKNGQEASYGTKGSTRPDFHNNKTDVSVEVKNYNVETSAGRRSLERNVTKQAQQRANNLPAGTQQTVQVDVRGQNVSRQDLNEVVDNIVDGSNNTLTKQDITIVR